MNQGRILIVEDDPFLQMTLAETLESAKFEITAHVGSAAEAILSAKMNQPEIAVLDLDLGPGANGIDLAIALRSLHPRIGLIMLTSYSDPRLSDPHAPQLPKGTIFLTKSHVTNLQILTTAILQVKLWPLEVKRKSSLERSNLTQNQIEVLILLAEGLTTAEIATRQGISEKGVEGTISRLQTILGISKDKKFNPRIQLVRAYYALSGKKTPGA
jgi:DNA-binding NarL/FixJ family response regulator